MDPTLKQKKDELERSLRVLEEELTDLGSDRKALVAKIKSTNKANRNAPQMSEDTTSTIAKLQQRLRNGLKKRAIVADPDLMQGTGQSFGPKWHQIPMIQLEYGKDEGNNDDYVGLIRMLVIMTRPVSDLKVPFSAESTNDERIALARSVSTHLCTLKEEDLDRYEEIRNSTDDLKEELRRAGVFNPHNQSNWRAKALAHQLLTTWYSLSRIEDEAKRRLLEVELEEEYNCLSGLETTKIFLNNSSLDVIQKCESSLTSLFGRTLKIQADPKATEEMLDDANKYLMITLGGGSSIHDLDRFVQEIETVGDHQLDLVNDTFIDRECMLRPEVWNLKSMMLYVFLERVQAVGKWDHDIIARQVQGIVGHGSEGGRLWLIGRKAGKLSSSEITNEDIPRQCQSRYEAGNSKESGLIWRRATLWGN